MKKIIKAIIFLLLLQLNMNAEAQILKAGDAVVTYSPNVFGNSPAVGVPSNLVLEILRTRNTAAAAPNMGTVANPALPWATFMYFNNSWTSVNLGHIFGVTIDNNRNIFVSATGFYGAQPAGKSTGAVYKIDATSGVITLWYNLNPGGSSNDLALGNIKFFNGQLYVSNLKDGKLYAISATVANTLVDTYTPTGFPANYKPCGLAIRNVGGTPRLFFSMNGFTVASTSVHSVLINVSGTFGGGQIQELSPINLSSTDKPITDIAFTSTGNKILLTEKTTSTWASTGAHNAVLFEFEKVGMSWVNLNPVYSIGTAGPNNSSGGIDFSNFEIFKNNVTACDTSIYVTSDAIFLNGNAPAPASSFANCYGVVGLRHQAGAGTPTGLNIDFDNNGTGQDKTMLGDVEVCDTTINCSTCGCGQWSRNGITINGANAAGGLNLQCGGSYSVAQNNFSGQLNAFYQCTGTCPPTYKWELLKDNTLINSGNTLPINLTAWNNLQCGDYTLKLMAKCGDNPEFCPDTCSLKIVVTCDPEPCCNKNDVKIEVGEGVYTPSNTTGPNAFGTLSQSFTLNASALMTEIRVDVEHFELFSNNPACISCTNKPITWGSLQKANYNGFAMVKPAGVGSPYFPGVAFADLRELIYKPGNLFTINNAPLNIVLGMPNLSEIDCCEIWANVCIKITFKDANCRECIKIVCLEKVPIKKSDKQSKQMIKSTIGISNF